MTEAAAGASVWALTFLPVAGKKRGNFDHAEKVKMAKEVGPLCPTCLERRTDLVVSPDK